MQEALGQIQDDLAGSTVSTVLPPCADRLSYWFKESSMEPLTALAGAIHSIEDPDCKNLFSVVFSATVRDAMLTYRGEVRLRRLVGQDLARFDPDPLASFAKRAKIAVSLVSHLPPGLISDVRLADAKNIPFTDESFDAVISSPPYGDDRNGVGYFQFTWCMLSWLGWEDSDINHYRAMTLGGVGEDDDGVLPSDSLLASLKFIEEKSRQLYAAACAFYKDYFQALREMVRVSQKWIVIVIGDRVLSRTAIKNGQVTYELASSLGLTLDAYRKRPVPQKRLSNLGNDGGGTSEEHILIFRKP